MTGSTDIRRRKASVYLGLAIVAASLLVALGLLITRPNPEQKIRKQVHSIVQVERVETRRYAAPIVGYGTIRPRRQIQVIPEVSGRIVHTHSLLAAGNTIHEGELLFAIDATAYDNHVRQVQAEIARIEAQIKRHRQEQVSLEARLAIAERQAELLAKSVQREEKLFGQDSTTEIELEVVRQRLLKQQEVVLTYQGQLGAIPMLAEEAHALLRIKQAQLQEATLNVDRTLIYCPFEAKVDHVAAQESQIVSAGTPVATLTDMQTLEILVAIDPVAMRWIDDASAKIRFDDNGDTSRKPRRIVWSVQGTERTWRGRIARLERLDEATRTAHVVVELDPAEVAEDLNEHHTVPAVGRFCRVELPTMPISGALVLPRSCIHDGEFVYVFEADGPAATSGRLSIKKVSILRSVENEVVVGVLEKPRNPALASLFERQAAGTCQVQPGDLLIVSPLPEVVEGMRLALPASPGSAADTQTDKPTSSQAQAPPVALPEGD